MTELQKNISDFLDDCRYMKGLSDKTLKAYTIDLRQFSEFCLDKSWNERELLDEYIKALYMKYKPKTAKRKVACLKTFFHYLENNDLIPTSPFHKIVIKRREPLVLPKVIPVPTLTKMLETAYIKHSEAGHSDCFYRFTVRDIAVMELLFATGVRVYELCNLKINDVDLKDKCIKVYGKGSKERYIQLTNKDVISALKQYQKEYADEITKTGYYFINNRGDKISEQSVRFMVDKYAKLIDDFLEPTYSNYEKSFQAFKALLTTDYEIEAYPPAIAEHETFGREFPGALIRKPNYKNCSFVESKFDSADGALSRFHDCLFESCQLYNCDLRYCDIFHSTFRTTQEKSTIASCNFSFGNFVNSSFLNTHFYGCSLRQMQIEGTSFKHCTMQNCSIEQSSIKDCQFEDLDLRKVGVRYCTFENTTFKSVTFHILDLARNKAYFD